MSTIDDDKEDVLVENNAQFIYQHIRNLENEIDKHGTRWFWELLQNAKDAKDAKTIEVALEYKDNTVIFKHTGKEFTQKEILHLIYHGSTKKGDVTKTGKFGTGFMATHLLSKKVIIKGKLLDEDKFFDFLLDRTGSSSDELRKTLEESYDRFKANSNLKCSSTESYNTQFIYTINPARIQIVENVLKTLKLTIPFVLSSSTEIGELKILDNENNFTIKRLEGVKKDIISNIEEIKILIKDENISVLKIENEFNIDIKYKKEDTNESSNEEVKLSLSIEVKENKVIKINENTPRLFYDFPLFTSESFKFPAIINSLSFEPKTERDGIYLSTGETYDIKKNKEILLKAFHLFITMLDEIISEDYYDVHFLAELKKIELAEVDNDWYNEQLKQLIQKIFKKEILRNEKNSSIVLETGFIPSDISLALNTDYWKLTQELYPERVVNKDLHEDWLHILKLWNDFAFDKFDFELTLTDIAKIIQAHNNLSAFSAAFFEADIIKTHKWLNNFYTILKKNKDEDLLEDFAIIADQNGDFINKTGNLKIDDNIDDDLKDILKKIGEDIRSNLIDKELFFDNITKHTQEEVFEHTIAEVIDIDNYFSADEYQASKQMLGWLLKHDKLDKLENFPVSVASYLEGNRDIHRLSSQKRLLSPVLNWEEKYRDYDVLFNPEVVLNNDYKDIIADYIPLLEAKNFLYSQPLYYEKHNFNKDDLKKVISKKPDEEFWELDEEEDVSLEIPEIVVSKIPFFSSSDKSVLNNSRKANKRTAQLLEFLTNCVLENDSALFNEKTLQINNYSISIYPSEWLARLKSNQWVNIGKDKSETPNSSNLSEYFEKNTLLKEKLSDNKTAKLLNIIGVSVGDLTKNIFAKSDEEKFEWDKAYTSILSAGHNNQVKPEEILNIFNDPLLIEEIKRKYKEKIIVKNNRDIGLTVEEIFENIINDELDKLDLKITNVDVGRDFDIDFDFINKKTGNENILALESRDKEYFIELKSTRTDYIRMTKKQGELSTENPENFSLCIYKHNYQFEDFRDEKGNINEEIKNHIKSNVCFVTDIGNKLINEVTNVKELDNMVAKTRSYTDEIDVDVDNGQIKYRIKQTAWKNSLNLSEFIEHIKQKFNQ